MKLRHTMRNLLLATLLVGAVTAMPALAQVSLHPRIAPPAPQVETVPPLAAGFVWTPGYWVWLVDRYIWVRGRAIRERPGYHWVPDRWEPRGNTYRHVAGGWERDTDARTTRDPSPPPAVNDRR